MDGALDYTGAKKYYDRFGAKQDSQSFYEDGAIELLIDHCDFQNARSVFELGCGTGRLAAHLLADHLPNSALYSGVDLSETMVDLAKGAISQYSDRARVRQSTGNMSFPEESNSVDRFLSAYVFDLLSEADRCAAIAEARRILVPGGRICLVSLTKGTTAFSSLVSSIWSGIWRLNPSLVGGCKPIQLQPLFDQIDWQILFAEASVQFGVMSAVLVAELRT